MTPPVIRTLREAKAHNPHQPALVDVPSPCAHALSVLVRLSERHGHAGVIVTNIGPRSEAARVGMVRGDVLLTYDGVPLDRSVTLKHLTKGREGAAARPVLLRAARGEQELTFEVRPGRLGITFSSLFRSSI